MVMGIAPSVNDEGIFYSGNYITGKEIHIGGIPNSLSRYQVLTSLVNEYTATVAGNVLTDFLSSHENTPDSPCAHGVSNGITGQTLGSTLFDITAETWRISYNNPCKNKFQVIGF